LRDLMHWLLGVVVRDNPILL